MHCTVDTTEAISGHYSALLVDEKQCAAFYGIACQYIALKCIRGHYTTLQWTILWPLCALFRGTRTSPCMTHGPSRWHDCMACNGTIALHGISCMAVICGITLPYCQAKCHGITMHITLASHCLMTEHCSGPFHAMHAITGCGNELGVAHPTRCCMALHGNSRARHCRSMQQWGKTMYGCCIRQAIQWNWS